MTEPSNEELLRELAKLRRRTQKLEAKLASQQIDGAGNVAAGRDAIDNMAIVGDRNTQVKGETVVVVQEGSAIYVGEAPVAMSAVDGGRHAPHFIVPSGWSPVVVG